MVLPLVRSAAEVVADLVLPTSCPGCGAARTGLCRTCAGALAGRVAPARPQPVPVGLPPAIAAAPYDGVVASLLVAYKDRGRLDLARPLGRALADAVVAVAADAAGRRIVLVPVPSSRAARAARGRAHMTVLARHAATRLRGRGADAVVLPCLLPVRGIADQAGLTASERSANLAGALAVRRRTVPVAYTGAPRGGRAPVVVVVDDVLTTGATLAEGARALSTAGLPPIGAAVVAAALLRRPSVG